MKLLPYDAELSRKEVEKLHIHYVNSGLVQLLSMLNLNRSFVKAQDCLLWDSDGNEYLDFLGGYGSLNLGHNNKAIFDAIKKVQGAPNICQTSVSKYQAILAHNLSEIAPGKIRHSFFCNSGAEAVEGALKIARAATGKPRALSLEGSFHGKTMGALSLTGKASYQAPFLPMVPFCEQVPFGSIDHLETALQKGDVACFIVEPILGEGGVRLHPEGFLKKAESLCHKYDALFILDEVQTGMGRTGTLFAAEHDALEPDIMCLSKSLSGGYIPIGATMTTDKVWQKALGGPIHCLRHTSTFGGNAFACTAGIVAIQELVEKDLPLQAAEKGPYLLEKLSVLKSRHSIIKDVRGKGLLIGVEFDASGFVGKSAYEFIGSMIVGEMLTSFRIITAYTLNNPTVVRLEPPLTVSYEQIDYLVSSFETVLKRNKSLSKLIANSLKTGIAGIFARKL